MKMKMKKKKEKKNRMNDKAKRSGMIVFDNYAHSGESQFFPDLKVIKQYMEYDDYKRVEVPIYEYILKDFFTKVNDTNNKNKIPINIRNKIIEELEKIKKFDEAVKQGYKERQNKGEQISQNNVKYAKAEREKIMAEYNKFYTELANELTIQDLKDISPVLYREIKKNRIDKLFYYPIHTSIPFGVSNPDENRTTWIEKPILTTPNQTIQQCLLQGSTNIKMITYSNSKSKPNKKKFTIHNNISKTIEHDSLRNIGVGTENMEIKVERGEKIYKIGEKALDKHHTQIHVSFYNLLSTVRQFLEVDIVLNYNKTIKDKTIGITHDRGINIKFIHPYQVYQYDPRYGSLIQGDKQDYQDLHYSLLGSILMKYRNKIHPDGQLLNVEVSDNMIPMTFLYSDNYDPIYLSEIPQYTNLLDYDKYKKIETQIKSGTSRIDKLQQKLNNLQKKKNESKNNSRLHNNNKKRNIGTSTTINYYNVKIRSLQKTIEKERTKIEEEQRKTEEEKKNNNDDKYFKQAGRSLNSLRDCQSTCFLEYLIGLADRQIFHDTLLQEKKGPNPNLESLLHKKKHLNKIKKQLNDIEKKLGYTKTGVNIANKAASNAYKAASNALKRMDPVYQQLSDEFDTLSKELKNIGNINIKTAKKKSRDPTSYVKLNKVEWNKRRMTFIQDYINKNKSLYNNISHFSLLMFYENQHQKVPGDETAEYFYYKQLQTCLKSTKFSDKTIKFLQKKMKVHENKKILDIIQSLIERMKSLKKTNMSFFNLGEKIYVSRIYMEQLLEKDYLLTFYKQGIISCTTASEITANRHYYYNLDNIRKNQYTLYRKNISKDITTFIPVEFMLVYLQKDDIVANRISTSWRMATSPNMDHHSMEKHFEDIQKLYQKAISENDEDNQKLEAEAKSYRQAATRINTVNSVAHNGWNEIKSILIHDMKKDPFYNKNTRSTNTNKLGKLPNNMREMFFNNPNGFMRFASGSLVHTILGNTQGLLEDKKKQFILITNKNNKSRTLSSKPKPEPELKSNTSRTRSSKPKPEPRITRTRKNKKNNNK